MVTVEGKKFYEGVELLKIALIINDDFSMYHFRGGLIQELVRKGIQVSVIVPPGNFNSKLEDLGVCCIPMPMERFISIKIHNHSGITVSPKV